VQSRGAWMALSIITGLLMIVLGGLFLASAPRGLRGRCARPSGRWAPARGALAADGEDSEKVRDDTGHNVGAT